jgi:hypothetical protein
VASLVTTLRDLDQDVWLDEKLHGSRQWWDQILERIRSADVLVFAMSRESLKSEVCRLELEYAVALKKVILPVRIEKLRAQQFIPQTLARIQNVDYVLQDKAAAIRLARAISAFSTPSPLPEPLPYPPALPVVIEESSPSGSGEQTSSRLYGSWVAIYWIMVVVAGAIAATLGFAAGTISSMVLGARSYNSFFILAFIAFIWLVLVWVGKQALLALERKWRKHVFKGAIHR